VFQWMRRCGLCMCVVVWWCVEGGAGCWERRHSRLAQQRDAHPVVGQRFLLSRVQR
jgi:hypothetical protein